MRKLLLAVLLVSLAGSAFGAGTFATFNASTTNGGSTFASGTLVLSNKVNAGTACLSSGTTATNNVNTDTNSNATCGAAFTLATKKPGDTSTVQMQIQNVGTIDANTGLVISGNGACADANTAEAYHGTGSMCGTVQTYVQETNSGGTATACRYGRGAYGMANGTAITFPLTMNQTLGFTLDGSVVAPQTVNVTGATAATLTSTLNGIGAFANAVFKVGDDNILYISSKKNKGDTAQTGTSAVATFTGTGLANLGLSSPVTTAGGAVACDTTNSDPIHTLTHFTTTYTGVGANVINSGVQTAGTTDYYTLGVSIPLAAGNTIQGRQATFGYTWTATQ